MKQLLLFTLLGLTGCSTLWKEHKKEVTLECVKQLLDENVSAKDAYAICRQIHRIPNLKE